MGGMRFAAMGAARPGWRLAGLAGLAMAGLAVAALTLAAGAAGAQPRALAWEHWRASDEDSAAAIDHRAFDDFLRRYRVMGADGVARVRYGAISDADLAALRAYTGRLEAVDVARLRRDEQRALWVNLYNALTIAIVREAWPVRSIRRVGLFGPWRKKRLLMDGLRLSLDDIEHRILRPLWGDARIHYVLNCASIGCPNLPERAMGAADGERMLEAAAREYINHSRAVDFAGDEMVLSRIYDWFAGDFGSAGQLRAHLAHYAAPQLRERILAARGVRSHRYDWAVNAAADGEGGP